MESTIRLGVGILNNNSINNIIYKQTGMYDFILWYDIPGGNVIYAIIAMAFLISIYYLFNLNKQFTNN